MTPGKLLVAAWGGGLATLGGAAAILVLVLTSPPPPAEVGAPTLAGAVIGLILLVFAVGWVIGAGLGTKGVIHFAVIFAALCALALSKAEHLDTGLMGAAVLIGPYVTGWALGCARALRRESAEGQG